MAKFDKKLLLIPVIAVALFLLIKSRLLDVMSPPNALQAQNNRTPEKNDLTSVKAMLPDTQKISLWFNAQTLKLKNNADVKSLPATALKNYRLESRDFGTYPKFKTKAVNGLPAVYFDGKSYFENNEVLGSDLVSPVDTTVFAVIKDEVQTTEGFFEFFGWGDCKDNRLLVHVYHAGSLHFHYGKPDFHASTTGVSSWGINFNLVVLNKKSDSISIEVNNSKEAEAANHESLPGGEKMPLMIGSSACGHPFTGEIAELMVVKNMSDNEKNSLTKYLIEKYKLAF